MKLSKADGPQDDHVSLSFKSLSMMVVIQGTGRVRVKREGSIDQDVEHHCAYYIVPDSDIEIYNESLTEDLILFIANSDI